MKGNPAFSPPDWIILSILSPQVQGGKRDAISHDAGRGKSGLQIRARGLGRALSHQQPLSIPACENGGGRRGRRKSEEGIQVKAGNRLCFAKLSQLGLENSRQADVSVDHPEEGGKGGLALSFGEDLKPIYGVGKAPWSQ